MTLTNLAYRALRATWVSAAARRLQPGAAVFCYHNVVDASRAEPPANGAHLAADRFAWQAEWIARRFRVIPLAELIARLESGRRVRGLAALTFDDAYQGFFTHALPVLRRLAIPATVFVVSEAAAAPRTFWWDHPETLAANSHRRNRWFGELRGERDAVLRDAGADADWKPGPDLLPMDWAGIRVALGADLDVGAHSATHRALTSLAPEDLNAEVAGSRASVSGALGRATDVFAYPYGLWDDRVRSAVQAAGYRGAVTLNYGFAHAASDRCSLRRINVPANIDQAAFEAWASGLHLRELLS